jgi:hypothetical protein
MELNTLAFELVTKHLLFTQVSFRDELRMINYIV